MERKSRGWQSLLRLLHLRVEEQQQQQHITDGLVSEQQMGPV